jgi:hypothetical protein
LSHPTVNDFIDEKFTSVQYSSFSEFANCVITLIDNAGSIVRDLGKGALIRKKDNKGNLGP